MKITILITFLLTAYGCAEKQPQRINVKPKIEGGQCTYSRYRNVAYVSNYEIDENDSLIEVKFTFADESPTGLLRLRGKQIREIGRKIINVNTVKDTSVKYLIEGVRIQKGSCYPYFIDKISRKN